jgi:hypothetical protein
VQTLVLQKARGVRRDVAGIYFSASEEMASGRVGPRPLLFS